MRAGAGEVQVRDVFAAIVRPHPGALHERRFDGEGAAQVAAQFVAEVQRVDPVLRHDVLSQVGQVPLLEVTHDRVAVGLRGGLPVGGTPKVRHRRQDVERIASGRRERRIGGGRSVEVQREVLRKHLALEDILEEAAVARAEQDLVMRDVVVGPVGAEVDHEERHRIVEPFEVPVRVLRAHGRADEAHVGVRHVAVGHHDVRRQHLGAVQPNARGPPARRVHDDLARGCRQAERAAQLLEQLHQRAHQCPHAAHREPDAPLLFEVVDQRVDARGAEGVAPDQQGVEREHLPQPLVGDVGIHQLHDRAVCAQPHEVGQHARQAAERQERLVDQVESGREDAGGLLAEATIAGHVVRIESRDFRLDLRLLSRVAEDRAVLEADVVERLHRHHGHVVRHLPAGQCEQLVDQLRGGDDRRATVEGEAILLVHVGSPARLVTLLDDGDVVAGRLQADRRREPTEPRPDDDDPHAPAQASLTRSNGPDGSPSSKRIDGPSPSAAVSVETGSLHHTRQKRRTRCGVLMRARVWSVS